MSKHNFAICIPSTVYYTVDDLLLYIRQNAQSILYPTMQCFNIHLQCDGWTQSNIIRIF